METRFVETTHSDREDIPILSTSGSFHYFQSSYMPETCEVSMLRVYPADVKIDGRDDGVRKGMSPSAEPAPRLRRFAGLGP